MKLAETNYTRLSLRQRKVLGKANTRNMCMHYSWDFAQQVHYPYEDQQVGPIYFKTPRRAQLFGICCEGIPCQVNYLIDEADFLDKSANTVISLLDHYFTHHGLGETHALLTADNCVGQNKNNAVLHYLLFRTLMGLHDRIDLSFMMVGHTKFAPDGYFGLIKYRYRRSRVYTYDQLVDVIEHSTEDGHNLCQRSRNPQGEPQITYRDWSSWLLQYFRKLPNLTTYQHFSMSHTKPGVITVKERVDTPEEEYVILQRRFPYGPNKQPRLPKQLHPTGLPLERAWYLYEQIREFIPSEADREQTCPKPIKPKPMKSNRRYS